MNPAIIIGGIALFGLLAGMMGGDAKEGPPEEQPGDPVDPVDPVAILSASFINVDVT